MSAPQHTAGPWSIDRDEFAPPFLFVCIHDDAKGHLVAGCCGEANARLVAAAPDLLEALRAMLTAYGGWGEPTSGACAKAIAAIERATGEAP